MVVGGSEDNVMIWPVVVVVAAAADVGRPVVVATRLVIVVTIPFVGRLIGNISFVTVGRGVAIGLVLDSVFVTGSSGLVTNRVLYGGGGRLVADDSVPVVAAVGTIVVVGGSVVVVVVISEMFIYGVKYRVHKERF